MEDNPLVQQAPCLNIEFHHYNPDGQVHYPHFEEVLSVASEDVKENNEIKLVSGMFLKGFFHRFNGFILGGLNTKIDIIYVNDMLMLMHSSRVLRFQP